MVFLTEVFWIYLILHLYVSETASIQDLRHSACKTTVYVHITSQRCFYELFLIAMSFVSLVGSALEKVCMCIYALFVR